MNSQLIYSNNDSNSNHSTGVKWTRKLHIYICGRQREWHVPEKTRRRDATVLQGVLYTGPSQKITPLSLHDILVYSKHFKVQHSGSRKKKKKRKSNSRTKARHCCILFTLFRNAEVSYFL